MSVTVLETPPTYPNCEYQVRIADGYKCMSQADYSTYNAEQLRTFKDQMPWLLGIAAMIVITLYLITKFVALHK